MLNLTLQQFASFNRNGYLVIKNFCSSVQTNYLLAIMDDSNGVCHFGKNKELPWWKAQDVDELSYITHSERVVKSVAKLLNCDTPVCHIHTKTVEKVPGAGGSWAWHQDYAYWYANQLLFPDQVTSFMVSLTHMNKASGCSQVIKGSHKLGRLDHGFGHDNKPLGADLNMVDHALETMELVDLELAPGDALFFHSNLLHRGQANISGQSTWSIVSTYASQSNLSTNDTYAAWHLPIEVISNEAILERQRSYFKEPATAAKKGHRLIKELAASQLLHAS